MATPKVSTALQNTGYTGDRVKQLEDQLKEIEDLEKLEAEQANEAAAAREESLKETADKIKAKEEAEEKEAKEGEEVKESEEELEVKKPKEKSDEKLSTEEETFKKRYGDLRRHMAEKEDQWKSEMESQAKASTIAPTADEDLEKWQEANPEIASIIDTIATKKAEERLNKVDSKFKEMDRESAKLREDKAEAAVAKAHPDFAKIREDDSFHTWASTQPKAIQDALYTDPEDSASVIRVVDFYKMDMKIGNEVLKEKTKKAEESAATVVSTSKAKTTPKEKTNKSVWSESKVEAMSDAEYSKNAEEIDKAMANGTFIFDLQ